ncbi:MAG TPA: hypothetical protein VIH61_01385 [Waddliaceae bacterium]
MELDELKKMWLSNDAKLEKILELNEQSIQLIRTQKLASKLAPLYRQRVVEMIFHLAAIILLGWFLFKNIHQFPYAVSAIILLAFYTTTFLNALRQINIIKGMDYGKDLATLQSSLVVLQTHMLNYARLAVLFVPTFLAYPVILTKAIRDLNIKALAGFDIIRQSNGNWWSAQLIAFIILIPLGLWFYKEVSYKNVHKKWVKSFIQRSFGTRVTMALEFLKELQSLKHEIV